MTLLLRHNNSTKMTKASLDTELALLRGLEQVYLNGKLDEEFDFLDFQEGYYSKILLFPLIYSNLTKTNLKKLYDNIINYITKRLQERSYLNRDMFELLLQMISTSILIQYLIFGSDIDKNIRGYKKIANQIRRKYGKCYTTYFDNMFCEFSLLKYSELIGTRFPASNRSRLFTVIKGLKDIIISGSCILGYRINPVYLSIINRKLENIILKYSSYDTTFAIPLPVVV